MGFRQRNAIAAFVNVAVWFTTYLPRGSEASFTAEESGEAMVLGLALVKRFRLSLFLQKFFKQPGL